MKDFHLDIVEVLHDYTPKDSTCLALKKGDNIFVHSKDASGWWDGTLDGKRGWFPSNFVKSIRKSELSWETLIEPIVSAIADLNETTKSNQVTMKQTQIILSSVKQLLASSGTRLDSSPVLQEQRELASFRQELLVRICKLLLATQVACGTWPPPDAIKKVRFYASQVLITVREFVGLAQDCNMPLMTPTDADFQRLNQQKTELIDSITLDRLDDFTETIMNSLTTLLNIITQEKIVSQSILDHSKKTTAFVGQLMSLVDELPMPSPGKDVTPRVLLNFVKSKESVLLYSHELLNAAVSDYAPNNNMNRLLECTTNLLESIENVVALSRVMIEHYHANPEERNQNLANEIHNLQNKTASIRFRTNSVAGLRPPALDISRVRSNSDGNSKLSKFFGDDFKSSEPMPWFLKRDIHPSDIILNMESNVIGGTFEALVEVLTLHDAAVDLTFGRCFLLTFHLFASPLQFVQSLIERFSIKPPELSPDELKLWLQMKQIPIREKVSNILLLWLESFWLPEDATCLEVLHEFVSGQMMTFLPTKAKKILKTIEQVIKEANTIKSPVQPLNPPQPILPRNLKRFQLLDLDPLEVARQLTLVESSIFQQIKPVELLKQEWSRKKEHGLAVNVRAMSRMSTKLTGWVSSSTLSEADPKKRSFVIKFFIKVADRCLLLHNFNTTMAIYSALCSSTVSRMKKSWDLLSSKTKNLYENIKRAMDHSRNYHEYRNTLKKLLPPCLPFLGLYLTDLTFTDEGNPDTRNNGLINFDKYQKTARIIQNLMQYQVPYQLQEVPEVQDYLLTNIDEHGDHDAQALYELSLKLEPKETTDSAPVSAFSPVSASSSSRPTSNAMQEMETTMRFLEKAGLL